MRHTVFAGLVGWCLGLILSSQAWAFVRNEQNWSYMANPMGEAWVVCPERMPGNAVQRIKDGANTWNYERFRFAFASDACPSSGDFPLMNSVNQVDTGRLSFGVLANTVSFFFTDAPTQNIECDMRFSSTVNWYTGTGTPAADQFDLWSVATHEMGHCLGLDHEDSISPLPVMRSAIPAGNTVRQLTADDIAGRDAIYGSASGSGGDGGGGGGCALMVDVPTSAAALLAALGNILVPLLVVLSLRLWMRKR